MAIKDIQQQLIKSEGASGEFLINDINLNDCNDFSDIRNNHLGFIFQFHNLISELNVIENISIKFPFFC